MSKHRDTGLPPDLRAEPDGHELDETWRVLDGAAPGAVAPEETDRAWTALAARIGLGAGEAGTPDAPAPEAPATASPRRVRSIPGTLLRVAAVAVLALGGTAAWYAVPVTHAAGSGERLSVALPDGSVAELNAGSTLRHRRGFAWFPGVAAGSRTVELEGEAFFDVERGVRPFRVEAGPARVRVLGTRFNVRAREADEALGARVEVEEGRVEVRGSEGTRTVILTAGEAARVDPGAREVAREVVLPERIAAWRTGGLTVVDEPLSAILTELALRFGVEISLSDPAAGTTRLNVYYPALESLESVLSDLAIPQGLQYRRTNDGWELF